MNNYLNKLKVAPLWVKISIASCIFIICYVAYNWADYKIELIKTLKLYGIIDD